MPVGSGHKIIELSFSSDSSQTALSHSVLRLISARSSKGPNVCHPRERGEEHARFIRAQSHDELREPMDLDRALGVRRVSWCASDEKWGTFKSLLTCAKRYDGSSRILGTKIIVHPPVG